jgi:dynein heavy chain 2
MFTSLFVEALSLETETTSTDLRIKLLKNRLQLLVFTSVSRSLFKADRLMFALHLAHGMHPDQFEDGEWEFFVGAAHKGSKIRRASEQHSAVRRSPPPPKKKCC